MFLTGKKVHLRPLVKSDVQLFMKWFNDSEVSRYLTVFMPLSERFEENWMEEACTKGAADNAYFIIEAIEKDGFKPIGNTGLVRIEFKNQTGTFGISIGEKEYWNHGYGTEAASLLMDYGFDQLNLHRISSFVFAKNERSRRLHRKLGFQEEGMQREIVYRNGEFNDLVVYGLLKNEWKQEDNLPEHKFDTV
jgi:RimJ/RimL family protein N-acetyltransferase